MSIAIFKNQKEFKKKIDIIEEEYKKNLIINLTCKHSMEPTYFKKIIPQIWSRE
jgi:hypothetical protein